MQFYNSVSSKEHHNFGQISYLYHVKIDLFAPSPVFLYKRISLFPVAKGKFACKDRGSLPLSLHCKDREFPRNVDVVPKISTFSSLVVRV